VTFSLLVTQLGYAPDDPKRFVVRAPAGETADPEVRCLNVVSGEERSARIGERVDLWGMSLWAGHLDGLHQPGRYVLALADGTRSQEFAVEAGILLARTLEPVVAGLERRIGGKLGWQDCAFDGRGLESHAIVVIGLIDVLELVPAIDVSMRSRLLAQARHGAEYLMSCQRADGSFMNEYYIGRDLTVWTVCGLASIALARSAGFVSSGAQLDAAKRGWEWVREHVLHGDDVQQELHATRQVYGQYAPWQPPTEPRARDVLLMLRLATDLYRNTNDLLYAEAARKLALTLRRSYQVTDGTGPYRGDFRAWPGQEARQPAWEHVGWGFGCGAVLPHDLSGLVSLLDLFPDSPDVPIWRASLWDYAAGYLMPTTASTPFGIYPLTQTDGDLRFFGPAWHGFNGVYGQIARTATQLARVFGAPALERIAHDNLQWVAGVNVGAEVEPGSYRGLSWFHGIGDPSAEAWSGIAGSIGNGFSASPQFRLDHLDDAVDAPRSTTNEDWLVHTGSWLSGVAHVTAPAHLKIRVTRDGVATASELQLDLGADRSFISPDGRGIALVDDVPRMRIGTVAAEDSRVEFATVSGTRTFVEIELAPAPRIETRPGGLVLRNPTARPVAATVTTVSGAEIDRAGLDLPATSEFELDDDGSWRLIVLRDAQTELRFESPLPDGWT
jgi:hypothetical protein